MPTERRTCPHPDCTVPLPREVFACRPHWFELPAEVRARIGAAFRAYTRDPLPNVMGLMNAQHEAEAWWSR